MLNEILFLAALAACLKSPVRYPTPTEPVRECHYTDPNSLHLRDGVSDEYGLESVDVVV